MSKIREIIFLLNIASLKNVMIKRFLCSFGCEGRDMWWIHESRLEPRLKCLSKRRCVLDLVRDKALIC